MTSGVCSRCGTRDATADLFGGVCAWCKHQERRLQLLVFVVVLALGAVFIGVDLAVNYWLYGDPWCALKTCIETK